MCFAHDGLADFSDPPCKAWKTLLKLPATALWVLPQVLL